MRRKLTGFTIAALLLGLMASTFLSQNRQLSVRLWLVVAVALLTRTLIGALLRQVPPMPAGVEWARFRLRRKIMPFDPRPRSLQALQGTLLNCRDNDRAYAMRLRPRLSALADHQLTVHHGVDRFRDPDRARQILGPVAWLVDDDAELRRPTLEEFDELLDTLGIPGLTAPEEQT